MEAAGQVHLAHVAGVGNGETEEVDEVEAECEGGGLGVALPGIAIDAAHQGEECGGDGERGEDENEYGGGETVGEEGGEEIGDDGDEQG